VLKKDDNPANGQILAFHKKGNEQSHKHASRKKLFKIEPLETIIEAKMKLLRSSGQVPLFSESML
jgi:hypothetical protein